MQGVRNYTLLIQKNSSLGYESCLSKDSQQNSKVEGRAPEPVSSIQSTGLLEVSPEEYDRKTK
jgi:hypothetical protein